MDKIYFAHAMCTYRTESERLQLNCIRAKFRGARITNPARYTNHPEKLADTLGFCKLLVEKCHIVVFCRLLGKVTSGVGIEVNHALDKRKPVFELVGKQLRQRRSRVRYISRAATIRLYTRYRNQSATIHI